MPEFDELQAIWQAQPPVVADAEIDALHRSLREYARRVNRLYIAKSVAIPVVIGSALAFSHPSRLALAMLVFVAVFAIVWIAIEWRTQRAVARLDFTSVSVDFVHRTVERLSTQRRIPRRYYWLLFAVLAGFENVWVASLPYPWTWGSRLVAHAAATALPWAAVEFGSWIRRRRFECECRPLYDRLTAIEKSLREEAE